MPEPGSTCSSQPAGNGSPRWGGNSSLGSSHGSDPGPTRAGSICVLWERARMWESTNFSRASHGADSRQKSSQVKSSQVKSSQVKNLGS